MRKPGLGELVPTAVSSLISVILLGLIVQQQMWKDVSDERPRVGSSLLNALPQAPPQMPPEARSDAPVKPSQKSPLKSPSKPPQQPPSEPSSTPRARRPVYTLPA